MTRLVNVSFNFGYDADPDVVRRKKEQFLIKLRMLNINVHEEDIEKASYSIDWVITLDEYLDCVSAGVNCSIKQEVKTMADGRVDDVLKQLQAAAAKATRFAELLPAIDFNQKCEVHMPGQALATHNETMLLEDSCTDVLQGQLDLGWRIIAACPQPNQRRPDYILGRFNPVKDNVGSGAARGQPSWLLCLPARQQATVGVRFLPTPSDRQAESKRRLAAQRSAPRPASVREHNARDRSQLRTTSER